MASMCDAAPLVDVDEAVLAVDATEPVELVELMLALEVEEPPAADVLDATEAVDEVLEPGAVLEPAGDVELPAGVDEPPAPLETVVPPVLPPMQLVVLPARTVTGEEYWRLPWLSRISREM